MELIAKRRRLFNTHSKVVFGIVTIPANGKLEASAAGTGLCLSLKQEKGYKFRIQSSIKRGYVQILGVERIKIFIS